MKKKFYYAFMLMLSMGFIACGGDDEPTPPTPPGDNETEEVAGENINNPKEYLENTAKLVMDYFDPNNQKAVVKLFEDFIYLYGEYDFEGEYEEYSNSRALKSFAHNTSKALKTGNYARANGSEIWQFSQFTGIYEPNTRTYCWERTGNSDALIFKFSRYGSSCELKIAASNGEWSVDADSYTTVKVPKTITITLTEAGTTHMTWVITSNYNESAHNASATIDLKIADLHIITSINGTDSQISATQSFTVGDKTIETAQATISGSKLCDRSAIELAIEREDETALKTFFKSATGETDLLGRIQIKAQTGSLYDIYQADEDRWDAYEESNWSSEAEERIEKQYAQTMNNLVKTSFYFARNGQKQGDIVYKAICEEEYWSGYTYTWWTTEPVLKFKDGSMYSFEEYFGDGRFSTTEDLFIDLVETYQKVLGIY